MSQPASNNNEPSKFNKLLTGKVDQSIKARLPRATGATPPAKATSTAEVEAAPEQKTSRYKFWPAFWTIASIMSMTVNVVLLAIGLLVLQQLGALQIIANDQASGILGGLYVNFDKMDRAHIKTEIKIAQDIPVNFVLNVTGPTDVTLTRDVSIDGALVTVNTGGLNIINARANIVLPAGTLLPINISNLVVPVNQSVRAEFPVLVDIPLEKTDLHDPFVGLKKVVEPFYCFIEPNAIVGGVNVCSPTANIQNPTGQTTP